MSQTTGLLSSVSNWLQSETSVKSAVLFGSSARNSDAHYQDKWSDVDLHVVTSAASRMEHIDWAQVLPKETFYFEVVRPATGATRKVTAIFASGQIDLVIIRSAQIRLARAAMNFGLHKHFKLVWTALNEIHVSIRTGYAFLKGEKEWGVFYARILSELPGVRVADRDAENLAGIFITEMLWVFQKLERGELAAAQRSIHRSLAETNFVLLREVRLRRKEPLPSFGLARRVEALLPPEQLCWISVDARCNKIELAKCTWALFEGLKHLMKELVSDWAVPNGMTEVLSSHSAHSRF